MNEINQIQVGGVDYNIVPTSENIASALGYTPADDADLSEVKEDIIQKQDAIADLDTIRAGASAGATALQTETDPTVPNWAKQANKPTYTANEVGAEPKKGEWVLKGTMTTPSEGIPVDLNGCTELIILSKVTGTSATYIHASWKCLIDRAVVSGFRHVYAHFADSPLGFECVTGKYSENANSVINEISGYSYTNGMKLSQINSIGLGNTGAVTSCDIKIYAR